MCTYMCIGMSYTGDCLLLCPQQCARPARLPRRCAPCQRIQTPPHRTALHHTCHAHMPHGWQVSFTRARRGLIVIGHPPTLGSEPKVVCMDMCMKLCTACIDMCIVRAEGSANGHSHGPVHRNMHGHLHRYASQRYCKDTACRLFYGHVLDMRFHVETPVQTCVQVCVSLILIDRPMTRTT